MGQATAYIYHTTRFIHMVTPFLFGHARERLYYTFAHPPNARAALFFVFHLPCAHKMARGKHAEERDRQESCLLHQCIVRSSPVVCSSEHGSQQRVLDGGCQRAIVLADHQHYSSPSSASWHHYHCPFVRPGGCGLDCVQYKATSNGLAAPIPNLFAIH